VREDVIDEVRRLLCHAPPATAGAEPASLTGEGDEALEATALALDARKTSAERAARQELPELPLDEAGKPAAVGPVARLAQERLEVLAHDPMEDGALGRSGLIDGGAHGRRASEVRAVGVSARRTALPASRPGRPQRGSETRRCDEHGWLTSRDP
jgi:hypothetical protein